MLSNDIRKLEDWWRSVLVGSQECTPEGCQWLLDGLQEARSLAAEMEKRAVVAFHARLLEGEAPADNVVVLAPRRPRIVIGPSNGGSAA